MARKKTSKKVLLSSPSSYRSLLFGIITVAVLFLIGLSVFQFLQNRKGDINGNGLSTEQIDDALKNASSYTVKPSDTLWGIAQSELGSGYEWPKIAEINNIKVPEDLKEGSMLTIPNVITPMPEFKPMEQTPTRKEGSINTYLIRRGDNLWDIAQKVYGDPYRWVDIASANNLDNPDLIHADNTLIIPK